MVAAIGKFFLNRVFRTSDRIVAIAGSSLNEKKYFKTLLGASVADLVEEKNLQHANSRFISGNVLTGRKISQKGYIGFYDHLLSVIPEGPKR